MPSQVLPEDARMSRFFTPTEAWKGRIASRVNLPSEWPVILVEIFHREDGQISMGLPSGSAYVEIFNSSWPAFAAEFEPEMSNGRLRRANLQRADPEVAVDGRGGSGAQMRRQLNRPPAPPISFKRMRLRRCVTEL